MWSTETTSRLTRQRVASVMLVLLGYATFLTLKLAFAHGDVSSFVNAGDFFVDAAKLEAPLKVLPHSYGYDGQFVYRLALDPLTVKQLDHGIKLDWPSLRAQRIGYPLLTYAASLGEPRFVAAALVLLNIVGLSAMGWIATGLALGFGRPAWHGLVIPFFPGLLFTLSRDTTEIISTALALLAVSLALRDRYWRAGLVACAAVLTRETSLLYLVGFGIVAMRDAIAAKTADRRMPACLLPVITLVGWQVILIGRWGSSSFTQVGAADFGWPPLRYFLLALRRDVAGILATNVKDGLYGLVTKLLLVGQVVGIMTTLRRARSIDWRLGWAWLCYIGMALFFSDAVWVEPLGYLRILADLYVTGCLLLLSSSSDRGIRLLIATVLPVWLMGWAYA